MKYRLTEDKLRAIIYEAVEQELVNEGWFGDKWNQMKSAGKTLTNAGNGNIKNRFNNAKKNWGLQGEVNDFSGFIQKLKDFVEKNNIDPKTTTVAQLIGFGGKASAQMGNRMSQIARNGGQAYR